MNASVGRCDELRQEVEGLRELHQIAGKAQSDIATPLNIEQPTVSRMEQQADMYLSTFRSYVEAVGSQLELTVKLPSHPAVQIHLLGDVSGSGESGVTDQAPGGERNPGEGKAWGQFQELSNRRQTRTRKFNASDFTALPRGERRPSLAALRVAFAFLSALPRMI